MPETLVMNTITENFVGEGKREESKRDATHILWSAENFLSDYVSKLKGSEVFSILCIVTYWKG